MAMKVWLHVFVSQKSSSVLLWSLGTKRTGSYLRNFLMFGLCGVFDSGSSLKHTSLWQNSQQSPFRSRLKSLGPRRPTIILHASWFAPKWRSSHPWQATTVQSEYFVVRVHYNERTNEHDFNVHAIRPEELCISANILKTWRSALGEWLDG